MKSLLPIICLNIINLTAGSQLRAPEYVCNPTTLVSKCDLKDVRVTAALPHFYPKSDNPSNVKFFEIHSRFLPKLETRVCQVFSNLEKYTIGLVDLEEIDSEAFIDCAKLLELNIFANKIHHLSESLLSNNLKLKTFYISSNFVEEIPLNLFKGLINLRRVQLPGQNFSRISAEVFKDTSHLQILDLSRNHLMDLDVENLVRYTSELSYIWLRDNDFKCNRLREIISMLKNKGITIEKRLVTSRERDHIPEMVDGVECRQ